MQFRDWCRVLASDRDIPLDGEVTGDLPTCKSVCLHTPGFLALCLHTGASGHPSQAGTGGQTIPRWSRQQVRAATFSP